MTTGIVTAMCGPEDLRLKEFDVPEPGPGSVLLKIRRANVCGSDLHIFHYESPALRQAVLGHEFVGEVLALGAGVETDFAGQAVAVGDRVVPVYYLTCRRCASCLRGEFNLCQNGLREWSAPPEVAPHFRGGFATHYMVHPDQHFYRVPPSLTDRVVAGANCGLAQVIFALDRIGLRAGETLVVQGAGGLGLYASSVGRELGARVVVIEREPERLALAARFGAHELIDMAALPAAEARIALVQKLTGGQGADVVLEVTGVAAAFPESIGLVRTGGRVVSMGNINVGSGNEIALAPGLLTRKNAHVQGYLRYDPWYLHRALHFLVAAADRYPFGELSDRDFSLHQILDALRSGEQRSVARAAVIMP
jgi:D-arabinose 1-dehydrogenase-like Zn-dependent alcohol dehydrogenase